MRIPPEASFESSYVIATSMGVGGHSRAAVVGSAGAVAVGTPLLGSGLGASASLAAQPARKTLRSIALAANVRGGLIWAAYNRGLTTSGAFQPTCPPAIPRLPSFVNASGHYFLGAVWSRFAMRFTVCFVRCGVHW